MYILIKQMLCIAAIIFLCGVGVESFSNSAISLPKNNPLDGNENNISTNPRETGPLVNLYDNQKAKFSIKYPHNWIYDDSSKGAVLFSGKKDDPAYYSTINIQIVLSKKAGGEYPNTKFIIDDVKNQVLKESPHTKFINSGSYAVKMQDGNKLDGEFITFIYSYKGDIIEQWQIVVARNDGLVFYTWAYSAPITQYTHDLPIAKAMLDTWSIY